MAQLDKLLAHTASRGALALKMEPGQQPYLETAAGAQPLLPQPLPATMMELLTKEVLPSHLESGWMGRGEARFEYTSGSHRFSIALHRTPAGIRLEARPIQNPDAGSSAAFPQASRLPPPLEPPGLEPMELVALELDDPDLDFTPAPRAPAAHAHPPASPSEPTPALIPASVRFGTAPSAPAPASIPAPIPTPFQPPALAPAPVATPVPHPSPMPPAQPSIQAATPSQTGTHPLAEKLFQALLEHKGSDLHVSSFETPIARIHGDMEDLVDFGILGPSQILEFMHAIAPPAIWQRFQEVKDADFAYPFEKGNCRLRVNFFEDRVGPGMVCRVIPNQIPDPDKLGLADPIRRLAELAKGLVLVTGPTGSGKSTTLAAILDLANQRRSDHILTIEDPIEFVHPRKKCLVNQREVGTHTESFKSGLRAALREDPDIVLVGEMRDLETIAIALETAITGHLVFGTLHTNSAVGTIDRIVDQFPSDRQAQIRTMLADCLKASISQTLLKKTTGGRVAAIESLFVTPAIANLIREGKNFQIPSAMQTGRAYGQRLMNDALIELIQAGIVEPMEAYMKCPDKEAFMATLKRANINWDPRGEERPMPM